MTTVTPHPSTPLIVDSGHLVTHHRHYWTMYTLTCGYLTYLATVHLCSFMSVVPTEAGNKTYFHVIDSIDHFLAQLLTPKISCRCRQYTWSPCLLYTDLLINSVEKMPCPLLPRAHPPPWSTSLSRLQQTRTFVTNWTLGQLL